MAENTNILEINGLHKNFFIGGQKFEVLAGVDLTVKKGELLAIVGASGCGKSTLLKLITTLETISSGEILLDGEPVNGPSPKCSMIFQEARLFPWLTVQQNVEFVISDKVPRAEKKDMVDHYIHLVGLEEFTNAVPISFPAACSSVSASPEHSPRGRSCCCWTNPSAHWIHLPVWLCSRKCCASGSRTRRR